MPPINEDDLYTGWQKLNDDMPRDMHKRPDRYQRGYNYSKHSKLISPLRQSCDESVPPCAGDAPDTSRSKIANISDKTLTASKGCNLKDGEVATYQYLSKRRMRARELAGEVPIPEGWEQVDDFAGCHHAEHAVLIREIS